MSTPDARRRRDRIFYAGLAAAVVAFFLGAWERRWIADDGLIVLRTVRNLSAGNGPVFNAGERVESNTSTAWTYLNWFAYELVGHRLELIALTLALVLSLVAVAAAMYGTRVMYSGTRRSPTGRAVMLLPFGVAVYIVLPPARDFATSGLETGLIIAWAGVMWLLVQVWARTPRKEYRFGLPTPLVAAIAFLAGLSPLVRPELAIVGVAVLALLAVARTSWAHLLWGVVIAATVPVVYQVWRMSYYGLPYPITAVAKDAGGAKWDSGFAYLFDLLTPYWLLLPIACLVVAVAAVGWYARRGGVAPGPRGGDLRSEHGKGDDDPGADPGNPAGPEGSDASGSSAGSWRSGDFGTRVGIVRDRARSTPVVTAVFFAVACVMLVYALRVGGDFMHGRVLLPSLFLLLLPVMVLPIPAGPPASGEQAGARRIAVPVLAGTWLIVIGWAVTLHVIEDPFREDPEQISADGIVDERQFYVQRTGYEHPILASDYLGYPRMDALVRAVQGNPVGGLYIAGGGAHDHWHVVRYDAPMPGLQPYELPEDPVHTVVFLNLGMTSMNLPLDVKIYDGVGLATPLAAHSDRMEDGRIGHDKSLPYDWFFATTNVITEPENFPGWIDPDHVEQARVALTCPATQEIFDSYMGPLTPERRWDNLMNAFSYAEYRINRVPAYEVQRCGLPMPPEVEIPGATG